MTFAEDAKRLAAQGYVLEQLGVYDMFPELPTSKPLADLFAYRRASPMDRECSGEGGGSAGACFS